MSQERMESDSTVKASTPYQAPDISSTLAKIRETKNKVRVIHGANEGYYDLTGKTVGSVRKSLREVFNIASDASGQIAGKEVNDDFILESGMSLEFLKEAGVKGIC